MMNCKQANSSEAVLLDLPDTVLRYYPDGTYSVFSKPKTDKSTNESTGCTYITCSSKLDLKKG